MAHCRHYSLNYWDAVWFVIFLLQFNHFSPWEFSHMHRLWYSFSSSMSFCFWQLLIGCIDERLKCFSIVFLHSRLGIVWSVGVESFFLHPHPFYTNSASTSFHWCLFVLVRDVLTIWHSLVDLFHSLSLVTSSGFSGLREFLKICFYHSTISSVIYTNPIICIVINNNNNNNIIIIMLSNAAK